MKMKAILAIVALYLSGCTAEYHHMATTAAREAAVRADNALEAAEWAWCAAPTSGAEKRRYWAFKKERDARMVICWPDLAD